MQVISIDIGIKNLSFCVLKLQDKEWSVRDWRRVNMMACECGTEREFLSKASGTKKVSADSWVCHVCTDTAEFKFVKKNQNRIKMCNQLLLEFFRKMNGFADCDLVIIENQHKQNSDCRGIQIALSLLLEQADKRYVFVSPTKKTYLPSKKSTYNERKHMSVEKIQSLISPEWGEFLKKQQKKDDLCDSLLNALCFMGIV